MILCAACVFPRERDQDDLRLGRGERRLEVDEVEIGGVRAPQEADQVRRRAEIVPLEAAHGSPRSPQLPELSMVASPLNSTHQALDITAGFHEALGVDLSVFFLSKLKPYHSRRSRTPGASPFVNSTPAASRAVRMASAVRTFVEIVPGNRSTRFTVSSDTPDRSARSRCPMRSMERAARICSEVRLTLMVLFIAPGVLTLKVLRVTLQA